MSSARSRSVAVLASSRATSSRLSALTRWRTLQVSCASVTTSDCNWLLGAIALIGGQHFVLAHPTLLTIQDLPLFPGRHALFYYSAKVFMAISLADLIV